MTIYQCSKGHASTESDYCSECGTKIQGSLEQVNTVNSLDNLPRLTKNAVTCPACTAPHDPDSGHFCEICGYNFNTGAQVVPVIILESPESSPPTQHSALSTQHSSPPTQHSALSTQHSSPPTQHSALSTQHSSPPTQHSLEITITVDPALRSSESPEPPNQRPMILRLDKESSLIGRRSEIRGINPEVALNFDSAVSHRHALINRQSDGSFTLRDIDSANGTTLNGMELNPMVDAVLKDGDELTLGHWTRIKVKFR
jgi:FHA domain